jgi:8-oxo-dGTP pyrophosphatase MutT (NUDIX family)
MSVTVRDAATVILVRDAVDEDGGDAIEVCMLRRNLTSEFVAGVYVFPGGSVDPDDRGGAAEELSRGLTDAEASAILGVESGGLSFWVAALRECFEEAGVLVAEPVGSGGPDAGGSDALLDTSDPEVGRRFAAYRDAVNEGSVRLLDVCRAENLRLATDTVHYVSHWITPELAPRRYDTRFFVTVAPAGQIASHDDGETIATIWVRPAQALARQAAGDIELLPPTIANLRSIEGFTSTAEVMAWAGTITKVITILPVVLIEDGRVLILRPGDEGYEDALEARRQSGSADEGDLAAARRVWGPRTGTD